MLAVRCNGSFYVIASQRVARMRARCQAPRSNPGQWSTDWIASPQALLAMTPFFGRERERAKNVLDATDVVIGANGVDQWRGGTIDPAVLIRPQSFCFKKARRDDAMVRRVNGGQPDKFRGIFGLRACDR
jgi:hypothetical protein